MATTEVSATRLYLGNLPKGATKQDVENHFATHGTGKITEIKLMNGFGFIEYEDAMDARDVVPVLAPIPGWVPRAGRETLRCYPVGLCTGCLDWFESTHIAGSASGHKYFGLLRKSLATPWTSTYMDSGFRTLKILLERRALTLSTQRQAVMAMAEVLLNLKTAVDLKTAVEKLDNRDFKGQRVTCVADVCLQSLVKDDYY
ncbi:hypothetical protein O1611_g5304 [Lasiodiplodia mahajangana]|uniref:Uncharacterized protein n=1 Tax=Lasiodiplodia mahajangana TaxID=1108764 RepID=A0ACC2JLF1_9PEZI|nr:hypothetical protein O1611_g5304 [Lasiodiplodia mahajangana]